MQEHIELGRHSSEAVLAAVFGPAIADFDALLFLRRDALPGADRAAQPAKVTSLNPPHMYSGAQMQTCALVTWLHVMVHP